MVSTGLSGYFSSAVRSRGESYYKRGQVSLRQGSDILVEAVVKGTKNYKVGAKVEKNILRVDCSCPYFDGFVDPCKHIWATLITADKMGYLRAATDNGISKLKLGAGNITLDEVDGIDDTDKYEDETPAVASFKKPQGFHQPPPWKEQLSAISHSMAIRTGSYEHWPPQRR